MNHDLTCIPPPPEALFETWPESARSYIQQLTATIRQLQTEVVDLKARLSKDSSNSSKPPSSDGLKRKSKSQRLKSGKKSGGQKGHAGTGLSQVSTPDQIVIHTPRACLGCGQGLDGVSGDCAERRQVFDIPQPKIQVTEHQVEKKKCPCCGLVTRAAFPDEIKGPVQYGGRAQALAAYFSHQHFIPMERVCQIFEDIFGVSLSQGTCANVDERLYEKLEVFESGLKTHLLASQILHFDETGIRCEKKLHWIHVVSSDLATLYTIDPKRGKEAIDHAGVLPLFSGVAVHDHWKSYFSYGQAIHALCNAHHLRELTFIHESEKEEWAEQMKGLLMMAKNEVERYSDQSSLPNEILSRLDQGYTQILTEGIEYHSQLPPLPKGTRGKQKQRAGKNLLDRLSSCRDCVLRFMHDFSVPFTNNQAEQDIRMVKLKQKVAGSFRTLLGAKMFCRIRSYISTARKQGWGVWGALSEAIQGRPRLL
ncbi:MAG TPA: IS66 family transposase, partial [Opitutales bacterium]|nr:IS66 family transposase [Opitutales bacterium]